MSERASKPVQIYQIKVTLRKSQPPIWRRIRLRSDVTLAKLHRILQRAMGWEDAHLHQFTIQGERYGVPGEEDVGPRKTRDERKYKLSDVMSGEGAQFTYLYDFGDNWEHILVVESTLPPKRASGTRRAWRGVVLAPRKTWEDSPVTKTSLRPSTTPRTRNTKTSRNGSAARLTQTRLIWMRSTKD